MMCIMLGAPILQPVMGWILSWHHDGNAASILAYTASDCYVAVAVMLLFLVFASLCAFKMFKSVQYAAPKI